MRLGDSAYASASDVWTPKEAEAVWRAGADHINTFGGSRLWWLRTNFPLPYIGHLLFRYRNQLFSVFVDSELYPFSDKRKELFLEYADEMRAVAAVLPMERASGGYVPSIEGWGLLHATVGAPLNPFDMATSEEIPVSDWELRHMAVLSAREIFLHRGGKILSSQPTPLGEPGLIVELSGQIHWAAVRGFRPKELGFEGGSAQLFEGIRRAPFPADISEIQRACNREVGSGGLFIPMLFSPIDFVSGRSSQDVPMRGKPLVGIALPMNLDGTQFGEPILTTIDR